MRQTSLWVLYVLAGLLAAAGIGNPSAKDAATAAPAATAGPEPVRGKTVKEYHLVLGREGGLCGLCHDPQDPLAPAEDDRCLRCHGGYEQVALRTAGLEKNPHDSPHYGATAACTACHREHAPSEALCNACHLFRHENLR